MLMIYDPFTRLRLRALGVYYKRIQFQKVQTITGDKKFMYAKALLIAISANFSIYIQLKLIASAIYNKIVQFSQLHFDVGFLHAIY